MAQQTSKQWWDTVKQDPNLTIKWLKDQYHGEALAAARVKSFADNYAKTDDQHRVLLLIARQEATHAVWVSELLKARGVTPEILDKEERYWSKTLPNITSWETGCAVAAQAEAMRLERIKAIADDVHAPADIRKVFQRILPQEQFHERAFRAYTTEEALTKTNAKHVAGLEALGLML